jgi:hypothetical protein
MSPNNLSDSSNKMKFHETVRLVVEQAAGKGVEARISLRSPLTFQSNRLYDVWVNGRHHFNLEKRANQFPLAQAM